MLARGEAVERVLRLLRRLAPPCQNHFVHFSVAIKSTGRADLVGQRLRVLSRLGPVGKDHHRVGRTAIGRLAEAHELCQGKPGHARRDRHRADEEVLKEIRPFPAGRQQAGQNHDQATGHVQGEEDRDFAPRMPRVVTVKLPRIPRCETQESHRTKRPQLAQPGGGPWKERKQQKQHGREREEPAGRRSRQRTQIEPPAAPVEMRKPQLAQENQQRHGTEKAGGPAADGKPAGSGRFVNRFFLFHLRRQIVERATLVTHSVPLPAEGPPTRRRKINDKPVSWRDETAGRNSLCRLAAFVYHGAGISGGAT